MTPINDRAVETEPAVLRDMILAARKDLPAKKLDDIVRRFVEAVVAYERTTEIGPFQSFAQDLTRSALLHSDPTCAASLRRADELDRPAAPTVTAGQAIAHLKRVG